MAQVIRVSWPPSPHSLRRARCRARSRCRCDMGSRVHAHISTHQSRRGQSQWFQMYLITPPVMLLAHGLAERSRGDLARMASCILMLRLGQWPLRLVTVDAHIAHTASAPRLASLALGYAKSPYLSGFAEAIAIKQHTRGCTLCVPGSRARAVASASLVSHTRTVMCR